MRTTRLSSAVEPSYREFNACITLLQSLVHRFGVEAHKISTDYKSSFVAWFISATRSHEPSASASSTQDQLRGEWFKALFDLEAIPDELLEKCPPQETYRLMPSIFKQMAIAYGSGLLPKKDMQAAISRTSMLSILSNQADEQKCYKRRSSSLRQLSACPFSSSSLGNRRSFPPEVWTS